jgi:hypothetical protein
MKKNFSLLSLLFCAIALSAQTSTVIGNFDDVTPAYSQWGVVTSSIAVPASDPTGNALLVNVEANNPGDGLWMNIPFTLNQYTQLKFNVQSTTSPFSFMVKFEDEFGNTTLNDTWLSYTGAGSWEEVSINLADIGATTKMTIFPAAWGSKPAFSFNIDNVTLFKAVTTGLENNKLTSQVSVYPNPTSEFIHVKLVDNNDWANIKLFTVDGKMIYYKNTTSKIEQIDVKKLNVSGLVFVKVVTSTGSEQYKVIVK